jgi:DedD protein
MADAADVDALKRRGRRRLIGAIALVLLAVIVLPMVFDAEPRQSAPPVSVRIPSEDEAPFKPKVVPKGAEESPRDPASAVPSAPAGAPPAQGAAPGVPPAAAVPPAVPPSTPAKANPAPAPGKAAVPAEKVVAAAKAPATHDGKAGTPAPAPASAAAKDGFIVPVAALADSGKLQELTGTLSAAKLPYYTEPVATAKGPVTRVRAGPFESREAAAQALEKLKSLGLKPGNIAPRG